MSLLIPLPDAIQIKTVCNDALSHGSIAQFANIIGASPGDASNRFNPNHERKLYLAEGAREAWAIANADPNAYRIIKTYYVMMLNSWAEPVATSEKSLSELIGEAAQKLNDLQRARFIDGRSEKVQREETLAIIAALQDFLAGLGKQLQLTSEVSPIRKINR